MPIIFVCTFKSPVVLGTKPAQIADMYPRFGRDWSCS